MLGIEKYRLNSEINNLKNSDINFNNGIKIISPKMKDTIYSQHAEILLKKFYSRNDQETPEQVFRRSAKAFSAGDEELENRLIDAIEKKWFMFSSPILSNATLPGEKIKAMPISCFLCYVPDTIKGLIDHTSELRRLSVKGGGVGGHWSEIRSISDISPGPIPFLRTIDADMCAYRQGRTRKGSYAAYINIDHPDIVEFINMRIPTGGDLNRKCLNLHNAVNITDKFMHAVKYNKVWELIDPNDKKVRDSIPARKLWEMILECRYRTGEPYMNFIDTVNKALPKSLKDKGLKIHGSNLCNEIHLPTSEDRTAVCCLSSLNLEYYDEWKDTSLISDLVCMLDNVLDFFIKNAGDYLKKAVLSAKMERSIGLGAMGFHSYLQRKSIAFETDECFEMNKLIFQNIKRQAVNASKKLAVLRGEAPDMKGTGMRNAHLLAIAPNANSSILCGCSPSIEPWKANAFTHRTRAGSFLIKNKYLSNILDIYNKNNEEVWSSIISSGGSVQHLDFISSHDKEVFKTAIEIDPQWIIKLGAERQKFICQGQSINLFFPAGEFKKKLHDVHWNAWEYGLKGLYYLRTESIKKINLNENECIACQG